ncbi:DUF2809 domain-containing protein [bacterium]
MSKPWQFRWKVILILIILVPIGIYTKKYIGPGQIWVNHSLGGVFYEIFWCLLISWFLPKVRYYMIAMIVFFVTSVLEWLQLWHPPILEIVRSTFIGRTLLGTTFTWWDFPYYFIGSIIGGFILYRLQKSSAL